MLDRTVEAKFFERVEQTGADPEASCWEWRGGKTSAGYGNFYPISGQGSVYTHRWAWEFFHELIPAGLHVDHLCRNVGCCNPWHLDPVTPGENARRGMAGPATAARAAARTRCQRDLHDWTFENRIFKTSGASYCRPCDNDTQEGKRRARGVAPRRLVSEATKATARSFYSQGMTQNAIAVQLGCSQMTVSRAIRGVTA